MIRNIIRESILGMALFLAALLGGSPPVAAQNSPAVSYDSFHDQLAGAGAWHHDDRWGDVWRPNGVDRDFRPYFDRGHWVYTSEYGWYWDADDPWGGIVYHYGRWVFDPAEGWIWVPGYVWAPAWVDWRFGDGYVGWMPAPPDALFLAGIGMGLALVDWGPDFYGYAGWYGGRVGPGDLWVFVGGNHFADPDFRRFASPRAQAANLIARTRNVTRYATVHGVVADRGIRASTIARLSGHPIRPVAAKSLLHGGPGMTSVSAGRRVALQERTAHPVPASRQIVSTHHGKGQTKPQASYAHPRAVSVHRHITAAHVHRPSVAHHVSPYHATPRAFSGARPTMHYPTTHAMGAPHPPPHSSTPPKPHS